MRRKFIRVALVLLILVGLPLIAWRMYLAHVVDKELERIRAAGLPINGEELSRWYPAVPDHQNAALVLPQAFALLKTINTDSDTRVVAAWKLKDRFPRQLDLLTSEQIELLRWYVETNRPATMKATEALKLPACRFPIDWTRLMNTELPHLAHLANLAYLYRCKSALAQLEGRGEEASADVSAILGLARALDNEPCLVSQLVRLSVFRMAVATLESRANAGAFGARELAALNEGFNQTRTTNIAACALIGERALTIPYFRMSRAEAATLPRPNRGGHSEKDSPLPCYGPAILRLMGYYELDYGSYLIGMGNAIAWLNRIPPENLRTDDYFARVGEASRGQKRTLSGIFLSTYAGLTRRESESIALQRLVNAALAVESFRNETGRRPEKLEELVPKYLEELPEDPFDGLKMKFLRKVKGYVVYSVGPDQRDDGGLEKADKNESEDKKSYDITFIVER